MDSDPSQGWTTESDKGKEEVERRKVGKEIKRGRRGYDKKVEGVGEGQPSDYYWIN